MTTTVDERKEARSAPWENTLYPTLRDPKTAWEYLEMATEDSLPGEVCLTLRHVIEANHDRPLIALLLLPRFVQYLQRDDIAQILETVQQTLPADNPAVSKLIAVLQAVDSILAQGLTVQLAGADQLLSDDAPEYQAWKQAAA